MSVDLYNMATVQSIAWYETRVANEHGARNFRQRTREPIHRWTLVGPSLAPTRDHNSVAVSMATGLGKRWLSRFISAWRVKQNGTIEPEENKGYPIGTAVYTHRTVFSHEGTLVPGR